MRTERYYGEACSVTEECPLRQLSGALKGLSGERPGAANWNVVVVCLRIGLGTLFIAHGWPKLSNLAGNIALWQNLHLPLPALLGPAQAVVEFFGGILLLCGLGTRPISCLLAVDVLGAILVVDIHTTMIIGLEWLALWVSLGLLASGAGPWSLDELLRLRRRR